jgi:TctA family transporter
MSGIDFVLAALSPYHITLALAGVVAAPWSAPAGLTATMAIRGLIPITFSMEPASA